MNRNSSTESYSLQVYPRGGRLSEMIAIELNPTRGGLIKNEPGTLIWSEALADGRQAVAKLYRRGLATWCRSRATGFRVQREFDGLSQLEAHGIPCSVPLFWCHGHFGLHGWGEILATEWVAQSQTLRDLVMTRSEVGKPLDLAPLFADVAMMHAAGIHHGGLRMRNILVKDFPEWPVFVFIDMSRFHRFPQDIRGTRMARYDLMFLCQGLLRYFSEDEILLWLAGYDISESKKVDLLARLKRFRSTSFLRRCIGAEFNGRAMMARFLTFFSRNAPANQHHSGSSFH